MRSLKDGGIRGVIDGSEHQDTRHRHVAAEPRRNGVRIAIVALLAIVLLLTAGAVGAVLWFQHRVDASIERFEDPFAGLTNRPTVPAEAAEGGQPVNILLLGSDSRISAGDPSQWSAGAQRTDAIMIAQVSGDRESAYVMSIPRDSWVEIPGYGFNKINAAFSYGGPSLMVATVEHLTGIPIDHVAIADFESFATLTDELGGVEITLSQSLDAGGEVLPAGPQRLDGEQALTYARERKSLSGGDFSRVQRQQNWIRAIAASAFDRDVLTNPPRLTSFLETVGRSVAVDEGFTVDAMRDLALSMRDIRPGDVVFMTAPNNGTGRSPDGAQSIVVLDEGRFAELAEAFATDSVADYLSLNPGAVETLGSSVE